MEKNNARKGNAFEELVDIRNVKIDRTLPSDERVRSFIEQIKNPYCFKVGDTVVKVSFADTPGILKKVRSKGNGNKLFPR